jgi:hypothetical protein
MVGPFHQTNRCKIISAKFKNLRRVLRAWQSQLSSLKGNIANVKLILSFLNLLEEFRELSVPECRGSLPPNSKFLSIVCRARMVSKRDNEIYTGSGL